jgi:cargo-transport protein YPP1
LQHLAVPVGEGKRLQSVCLAAYNIRRHSAIGRSALHISFSIQSIDICYFLSLPLHHASHDAMPNNRTSTHQRSSSFKRHSDDDVEYCSFDENSDGPSNYSFKSRFRNRNPHLPTMNGTLFPPPPPIPRNNKTLRSSVSISSSLRSFGRSGSRSRSSSIFTHQAKGATYARALDAARLRGTWEGHQQSGTGKDIPWSELIRKYMKHNPNEQITPSVATAEQQIRSALLAFYKEKDFNDSQHLSDSANSKGAGKTVFEPILPIDGSGPGWSGEGLANAIEQLDKLRSSARDGLSKQAVAALQAYAQFASGQDENAVELLHEVRFLEDVDRDTVKSGQAEGDYTAAIIMMGFTVYGMANERLFEKRKDAGYIPFALAGYASTIDLHEALRGGKAAKALRGLPPDEIERWGETALYRNALFSVRHGSTPTLGLNALRAYQANAGRWTANFRTPQRLVIFRTYLAVLNQSLVSGVYRSPPAGIELSKDDCRSAAYQSSVMALAASRVEVRDFESERRSRLQADQRNALNSTGTGKTHSGHIGPRTTSQRRPAPWREFSPSSSWWTNEFLTAQKTAAECLERTGEFPRAGKVNKAALELADELIKGV